MNSKFLVPFDTAKALESAGFDAATDWYYSVTETPLLFLDIKAFYGRNTAKMIAECYIAAPTYHEVLYWLQGKGIIIDVDYWRTSNKWNAIVRKGGLFKDVPLRNNREEALNAAILKAIEML